MQTGDLLAILWGHEAEVQGISFSPDGKTLASGSSDNLVMLWQLDQWTIDLDALLAQGCTWLADYLSNHPDRLEELTACQTPALLKQAAPALVTQAEALAQDGKIQEAVAKFRQALQWDQKLDIDPEARATQLANQSKAQQLVAQGRKLVKQGKVEEAIAAYTQAETLASEEISALAWSALCYRGSVFGHAQKLLDACEKAVTLAPDNGDYRDSRGLARALTGNTQGAIEDFQAFVAWTGYAEDKTQRQAWIKALQAGQNPFTPAEMERLKTGLKRYKQL